MGNQCKLIQLEKEIKHEPIAIFRHIVTIQRFIRGFLSRRQKQILFQFKDLISRERDLLVKFGFPRLESFITAELVRSQVDLLEREHFFVIGNKTQQRRVSQGEYWEGAIDANGELKKGLCFKDGILMRGTFSNNQLHGRGTIQKDGVVYEGQFEYGKRSGFGKEVDTQGNIHQGYWRDDKMNGEGEYFGKDGFYYQGEWQDGMYHGKGELVHPNGVKYVGQFCMHKKHGKGLQTWKSGSFNGEWRDGHKVLDEFRFPHNL